MALPQASFIYLNDRVALGVVYEEQSPEELQEVEAILAQIVGIHYQPAIKRDEGGSVIFVAVVEGNDFRAVMTRLKQAVSPKLAISMAELTLTVQCCRQGVHGTWGAFPGFIPGLEPADGQYFMNVLYVRAREIKASDFIPLDGSREAHPLYMDAFRALLTRLGVFVQEIELEVNFCC